MSGNLVRALHRHSLSAPQRLALSVAGSELDYSQLARYGRTIAGWLLGVGGGKGGRVGVLAGRSVAAYAGVVGACWAGASYVPLGLSWPESRLLLVLGMLRLDALIIDAEAAALLSPALLAACPRAILLADPAAVPDGRFHTLGERPDCPALKPVSMPDEHIAYIIFTSGTTGTPKGVLISLGAINGHLETMQALYRFTPEDRVALAFELTFDPSVFNLFITWSAGASLHVVPPSQLTVPISFIQDRALTVWNSAPTHIGLLLRLSAFQPGIFPHLRISIFGGDILTLEAAGAWQRAAPASVVDNVYGPTEATIECLQQRLSDPPVITPERQSLALGRPLPDCEVAVFDAQRRPLPPGEVGELAIAGSQLASGYLEQPELTAARFPLIDGKRWYLTGDQAYQDGAGHFHHLGRCDDQIKVRGHRVELGEVECHLRQVCGTEQAVALGWPYSDGAATGMVAFVAGDALPAPRAIRSELERRLPAYMVPQSIRPLQRLPLTAHGKVDRRALLALLQGEAG